MYNISVFTAWGANFSQPNSLSARVCESMLLTLLCNLYDSSVTFKKIVVKTICGKCAKRVFVTPEP
jgi:hypothetical protein